MTNSKESENSVESWSNGYGRILIIKGNGFESQQQILDD